MYNQIVLTVQVEKIQRKFVRKFQALCLYYKLVEIPSYLDQLCQSCLKNKNAEKGSYGATIYLCQFWRCPFWRNTNRTSPIRQFCESP